MLSVQNVSFKGYVPVTYYAKNPANGEYVPVIKNENIRKCNGFVVRNLNGTSKGVKNPEFVDFFKKHDSDYKRNPVVHSVYDKNKPVVYLVTGNDVQTVKEMAKPIGIAKAESIDKLGHSKSYEAKYESRNFFHNVKSFLARGCRRLKSPEGKNYSLNVYFNPKYTRTNRLDRFDFVEAKFVEEE